MQPATEATLDALRAEVQGLSETVNQVDQNIVAFSGHLLWISNAVGVCACVAALYLGFWIYSRFTRPAEFMRDVGSRGSTD